MIERGERLARVDTVAKLAGALGVEPGKLFEGIVWETGEVQRGRFTGP
jgi:transcriptional regulator with XRE-family HTH domain